MPTIVMRCVNVQSLDLRTAPPRAPRAETSGIIFLPRSIDKLRASLPGGHLGEYALAGHTELMLGMFGTTIARAAEIVAEASTDDEVALAILRAAPPDAREAWNAVIVQRLPRNGDRAAAIVAYPWLAERPDLILSLDVLAEDDRISFSG
jgi:hypothetical protein